MDFGLGILTFGTIGFVAVFAFVSYRKTQARKAANAPKSALAADQDSRSRALLDE